LRFYDKLEDFALFLGALLLVNLLSAYSEYVKEDFDFFSLKLFYSVWQIVVIYSLSVPFDFDDSINIPPV
jgi:hypothetical protein